MNISNNTRYQNTEEKIEKALLSLLHIRKYNDIYIKEICYEAGINRSSFYSHFDDMNDLMIKTEKKMSKNIAEIFKNVGYYTNEHFEKLFEFLYQKRDFYKAYLLSNEPSYFEKEDFLIYFDKINSNILSNYGYTKSDILYHMAFFSGGLKAIAKAWLLSGCKESPKQMAQIIFTEYNNNAKLEKKP